MPDADLDPSTAARSLVDFWEGLLEGYPDALGEDQRVRLDILRETIELYDSGVPWEWATSYTGLVEELSPPHGLRCDAGVKGEQANPGAHGPLRDPFRRHGRV